MLSCRNRFNTRTRLASIIYIAFSSHLAELGIAEAALVFFAYKAGSRLFPVCEHVQQTSLQRDERGNVASVVNAMGGSTEFAYTSDLNRLASLQDRAPGTSLH